MAIIEANGQFSFSDDYTPGETYQIEIIYNQNYQICQFADGSQIIDVNTTNINQLNIECLSRVLIGGHVTGLNGRLIVEKNQAETYTINNTNSEPVLFIFSEQLTEADDYQIRILSQPYGQTCRFSNDSNRGVVDPDNRLAIEINCSDKSSTAVMLEINFADSLFANRNFSAYLYYPPEGRIIAALGANHMTDANGNTSINLKARNTDKCVTNNDAMIAYGAYKLLFVINTSSDLTTTEQGSCGASSAFINNGSYGLNSLFRIDQDNTVIYLDSNNVKVTSILRYTINVDIENSAKHLICKIHLEGDIPTYRNDDFPFSSFGFNAIKNSVGSLNDGTRVPMGTYGIYCFAEAGTNFAPYNIGDAEITLPIVDVTPGLFTVDLVEGWY